jgi:hypothetical protein
LIIAPVAYATEALVGTVTVMAAALLRVTKRPLSVRTKVYVVPVWALRVRFCLASLIVGVLRVGLVSVLLVNVSVVALPTKVSVAAGSVRVPEATALACTVVVPEDDPENPKESTGLVFDSNQVRSSEVRTCFTVAPDECDTAVDPALPRTTVSVSLETYWTKQISSLVVSGSIATVNWSG